MNDADNKRMNEWIEDAKSIFREISEASGIRLRHDTHYDAQNFEFSVVKGKKSID